MPCLTRDCTRASILLAAEHSIAPWQVETTIAQPQGQLSLSSISLIWAIPAPVKTSSKNVIPGKFFIVRPSTWTSQNQYRTRIYCYHDAGPARDMMFVATNKSKASVLLGTGCLKRGRTNKMANCLEDINILY